VGGGTLYCLRSFFFLFLSLLLSRVLIPLRLLRSSRKGLEEEDGLSFPSFLSFPFFLFTSWCYVSVLTPFFPFLVPISFSFPPGCLRDSPGLMVPDTHLPLVASFKFSRPNRFPNIFRRRSARSGSHSLFPQVSFSVHSVKDNPLDRGDALCSTSPEDSSRTGSPHSPDLSSARGTIPACSLTPVYSFFRRSPPHGLPPSGCCSLFHNV